MIFKSRYSQMFYKVSVLKNSHKNTLDLKLCQKETQEQVLSCKFCETLKNSFFTEHLWTAASEFFHTFYCFLPRSELVSRNHVFYIFEHFYQSFRSWQILWILELENHTLRKKKRRCYKLFIKTNRKTAVQEPLFQWSYTLEACNFIERKLMSLS